VDRAAKKAVATHAAALARLGPPGGRLRRGSAGDRHHVSTAGFDGPLALLLALIEARQLDVLTVPLGAWPRPISTPSRHSRAIGWATCRASWPCRGADPDQSRAILPGRRRSSRCRWTRNRIRKRNCGRDSSNTGDSATRNRARRDIRSASPLPPRCRVAASAGKAGAPPDRPPLPPIALTRALDRLAKIVPPPQVPTEVVVRIITLAERRRSFVRPSRGRSGGLAGTAYGVRDRVVVVITFLAMLSFQSVGRSP